jgi:thymidylate synthase (FAD)
MVHIPFDEKCVHITTNMRVVLEHKWEEDLRYICEPTESHYKRITALFICDRGVSHELVRHRVMSFSQESTRYCNYSKDKFGNELTFIKPEWVNKIEECPIEDATPLEFTLRLEEIEKTYFNLLKYGCKPQEARAVLPNALKTEIVVTGFEDDWKHFFDLRCSESAHPDIRKLANKLKLLIDKQ